MTSIYPLQPPKPEPPRYHAFLLRVWCEEGTPPCWRASLQTIPSQERTGFADLVALQEFIQALVTTSLEEA